MQYRVLKNLSWGPTTPVGSGPRKGDVVDESVFSQHHIGPLVRSGAIAPVAYPPLAALAGWTRRAEICEEELGIETVADFLALDDETIAEAFDYRPRTIQRWRSELREAVIVPTGTSESGCVGCGKKTATATAKPESHSEEDEQISSIEAAESSEETE